MLLKKKKMESWRAPFLQYILGFFFSIMHRNDKETNHESKYFIYDFFIHFLKLADNRWNIKEFDGLAALFRF